MSSERRRVLEGLTVQRDTTLYLITVSSVLQTSTSHHSAATPTPPSSWAWRWACRRRSWPQSRNVTRPNHEPISAGSPRRGEATLDHPGLFCLSSAEQYNIAKHRAPVSSHSVAVETLQRFGLAAVFSSDSNANPLHHPVPLTSRQQSAPEAQTSQHKHRSGRASLTPLCSFNFSKMEAHCLISGSWSLATQSRSCFFFVIDGWTSRWTPSMPALSPPLSFVNLVFWPSSFGGCKKKHPKKILAVKSPLQVFFVLICHFDYLTVSCRQKGEIRRKKKPQSRHFCHRRLAARAVFQRCQPLPVFKDLTGARGSRSMSLPGPGSAHELHSDFQLPARTPADPSCKSLPSSSVVF